MPYVLIILLLIVAVVIGKTLAYRPSSSRGGKKAELRDVPIEPLQRAISCKTISYQEEANGENEKIDEEFFALRQLLETSFPLAHMHLQKEIVNGKSLLYCFEGREKKKKSLLLLAHMDVVPADEKEWAHPPFAGMIEGERLYGRGALDNKGNLVAQLQAVEFLLEEGFKPERSIYLAFGHDEEIGGRQGGAKIAALLQERGVELGLVLDEGGAVMEGLFSGLKRPVALVGVAEKGYVSFEIVAQTLGGHSATPPRETTIGILSKALARLEDRQPPIILDDLAWKMLHQIGPSLPLSYRLFLANSWLFSGVLKRMFKTSQHGAFFRTTMAPTMLTSGVKENVIPTEARAIVNCRLNPGDTIGRAEAYVKQVTQDPRIEVRALSKTLKKNPSPLSPIDEAFYFLDRAIKDFFPDAIVAPYLVTGATDARYFSDLTPNVYRFSPFSMTREDVEHIHGKEESISLEGYKRGVSFYIDLIREYSLQKIER